VSRVKVGVLGSHLSETGDVTFQKTKDVRTRKIRSAPMTLPGFLLLRRRMPLGSWAYAEKKFETIGSA